jgi:hypothetical protein
VSPPASTEEAKASTALRAGSAAAVGGSLLGLGAPSALILLALGRVAGLSVGSSRLLLAESLLLVAGAALLVVALFLYRRAFSHLKHVDPRLRPVSILCLVGSVGALALVVVGAAIAGGSSALTGCLGGHASHALSCLRSQDPATGYLSVVGFGLLWVGAAATAAGLVLAGRFYGRRAIVAGGALYGVLAVALAVPLVALLGGLPSLGYALAIAPVAAVAGALLVWVGARTTLERRS